MTAALEGGEWSAARPARTLAPGKTRYPLYRKLDGSQGRSGRAENLAPPGFDPRPSSPIQSLYRLSYPAHRLKRTKLCYNWCETWFVTLREDSRQLRLSENRVLRGIFESRNSLVPGGFRRVHIKEIHKCTVCLIILRLKWRWTRWVRLAACTRKSEMLSTVTGNIRTSKEASCTSSA